MLGPNPSLFREKLVVVNSLLILCCCVGSRVMMRACLSLSLLFDVSFFLFSSYVVVTQPVSGFLSEGLVSCLVVCSVCCGRK